MLKDILKQNGVIKEGHFLLTSGRHSSQYINKDSIFCIPYLLKEICSKICKSIESSTNIVDIITGPAIAGAVLAAPISILINKIFVYPEKHEGVMLLRRGYNKIVKDKNVWIIEDIITTGGSVENTIDTITFNGGNVIGVSCIWNRGNYFPSMGFFKPLIHEKVESYPPEYCPQCKDNIQLQDPKKK